MSSQDLLFLSYYFSGSDQEQEDTLIALGEFVKDQLFDSGTATIDIQQLEEGVDMNDFYEWIDNQSPSSITLTEVIMEHGIVKDIVDKINNNYGGYLDCNEQRADLFVFIDGVEESITAIDTKTIFFENPKNNVDLYDADIQHLVYLNETI